MIQSYIQGITNLASNSDSVRFQTDCIRTNSCNNWICHNSGSANYDIVRGGIYEIDFNATVSSAAVGPVAFALYNNGELIPGTEMVEQISAAGNYANVGIDKKIRVCCNGNANISVRAVPTVPTSTAVGGNPPIATQVPIILSANFSITRKSGI